MSNKSKWEITIDAMMIIGKYFETENDFINVMKTAKRYHDLTQMYHFKLMILNCLRTKNAAFLYITSQRNQEE